MLRFNTPNSKFTFNRRDADALLHSNKLFDIFPLHSMHFLIPNSKVHKERFEDILSTDENVYFIIKDVTAKSFIEKDFLEQFVKSGSLWASSHNARVEVENFLAIVPPGKLILSLEKCIAHSLALQKEKQKKSKRINSFETIVIDIICSAFSPGGKLYEFVSFELSKIEHIKFTLLLKWKPYGNICPHSIKAYFESQNIQCITCKPNQKCSSNFSVPMPLLNNDLVNTNVHDVLEWIGMQICGIKYSNVENEYVSKCFVPESSKILKILYKFSFEGFYSKVDVLPIIREIRKLFETDSTLPFIIVCLNGFQHSYVISSDSQYFSSCDKLICIIAFPSSDYWIITLNTH